MDINIKTIISFKLPEERERMDTFIGKNDMLGFVKYEDVFRATFIKSVQFCDVEKMTNFSNLFAPNCGADMSGEESGSFDDIPGFEGTLDQLEGLHV